MGEIGGDCLNAIRWPSGSVSVMKALEVLSASVKVMLFPIRNRFMAWRLSVENVTSARRSEGGGAGALKTNTNCSAFKGMINGDRGISSHHVQGPTGLRIV